MQLLLEIFVSIFLEIICGYTGAAIKAALRHGPHKLSAKNLHQEIEKGPNSSVFIGLIFWGTLIVFIVAVATDYLGEKAS